MSPPVYLSINPNIDSGKYLLTKLLKSGRPTCVLIKNNILNNISIIAVINTNEEKFLV